SANNFVLFHKLLLKGA
ncbi:hypothetical protein D039_4381B, partial [Vibrio parahaemolyticus EKP-028]